jgi:hypothetical protein
MITKSMFFKMITKSKFFKMITKSKFFKMITKSKDIFMSRMLSKGKIDKYLYHPEKPLKRRTIKIREFR